MQSVVPFDFMRKIGMTRKEFDTIQYMSCERVNLSPRKERNWRIELTHLLRREQSEREEIKKVIRSLHFAMDDKVVALFLLHCNVLREGAQF